MSKYDFKDNKLDSCFKGVELAISPDWANTTERLGWLRLSAKASNSQSRDFKIVAKKVFVNHFTTSTKMEFEPINKNQKAGLIAYFNADTWYFIYVTGSAESNQRYLQIRSAGNSAIKDHLSAPIGITETKSIDLKLSLEEDKVLFYYAITKHRWHKIGPSLKANSPKFKNLVGADDMDSNEGQKIYIGMCLDNSSDTNIHVDFDHFKHVTHK